MAKLNNPMDVFKLLNKSNCRKCNEKTCLAFAAAVFKEKRSLAECPYLDPETIEQFEGRSDSLKSVDEDMAATVESLREKVKEIDLEEAAARVGGKFANNRLTVKILGKDFHIDPEGRFSTEIHIIPWVTIPLLNYVLYARGTEPTGKWVPFRELQEARERAGLFEQRCEKPVKRLADTYTDLFKDMLELFDGKESDAVDSDIGVVLHPLPRVPILFCYWRPEEGLESSVHIFFDETANDNLHTQILYTLCAGLVNMFEKIALKHGG
jgi:hypothetical protein